MIPFEQLLPGHVLCLIASNVTPLPIHVTGLPEISVTDSIWVKAAALAAIIGAVATAYLAFTTRSLANETRSLARETTRLADETTILAKETRDTVKLSQAAIDAEERRHVEEFLPYLDISVENPKISGNLEVYLTNHGRFSAFNIRANNQNGSNIGLFRNPIPKTISPGQRVLMIYRIPTSRETLMGWQITYEDIFGNQFETTVPDDISILSQAHVRKLPKPG